jgi:isopenicillin N synthase-like dioxygenase
MCASPRPSVPFPPLVDLSEPGAPAAVDAACREVGFFQVVGHGIPQSLLDGVLAAADGFFCQDVETKLTWRADDPDVERGYSAKGSEGLSYSLGMERPPDLFEALSFGLEPLPDLPAFHTEEHHFFAPNIWPDEPAGLRATVLEYHAHGQRVLHEVTTAMALGLGLPADWFEPFTDASTDTLRINWFEGHPGDTALPDQFGIGPHTDFGVCTLLFADAEPALQVFTETDGWRYVVPEPGALVVNVGDLMARWTNDRWRSTLHRVVPVLSTDGEVRRRRSVPIFHEGNFDALVECLPTCTDADDPPRYAPITGGDHVLEKVNASRRLVTADAESTVGDRVGALG